MNSVLDLTFDSLCLLLSTNCQILQLLEMILTEWFLKLSLCLAVGCMKDVRFNNYRIPLDTHGKELVSVLSAQGIKEGCSSEACRNNPCNQEFICIDLWMMHECR